MLAESIGPDFDAVRISPTMLAKFITSKAVSMKPNGTLKVHGSINKTKTSLRAFFRWMHESGMASSNPASTLRIKHRRRPAPDILTPIEMKKLVNMLDRSKGGKAERDALLISLILNTGLRVSETVNIDIHDISITDRKIVVNAKGGETHQVFINSKLRSRLSAFLKKRKLMPANTPALFLSNRLRRLSVRQAETLVAYWICRAGIDKKITVHGLRHTFATNLLGRTGNLRTVQEALRHRNISTTTVYTHLPSNVLRDALESL